MTRIEVELFPSRIASTGRIRLVATVGLVDHLSEPIGDSQFDAVYSTRILYSASHNANISGAVHYILLFAV